MKCIFAYLLVLNCSVPLVAQEVIDYRFDEVRSKVIVATLKTEVRATKGSIAHGGDGVHTGWLGYALLGAPRYKAQFEIYSGSDVRLADGTPGVILTLDRGRLRAMFDKITGEEPRMVRTAGALLAVRGTRYGVEVNRNGIADLVVFDGTVEVRSPLRPEPLLVHAGEGCHFGTNTPPAMMPMPRGMTDEMWKRHGATGDGGMMPGGGMDGMGSTPRLPGSGSKMPPGSGSGHHGH